jgi:hypothetical protein
MSVTGSGVTVDPTPAPGHGRRGTTRSSTRRNGSPRTTFRRHRGATPSAGASTDTVSARTPPLGDRRLGAGTAATPERIENDWSQFADTITAALA